MRAPATFPDEPEPEPIRGLISNVTGTWVSITTVTLPLVVASTTTSSLYEQADGWWGP